MKKIQTNWRSEKKPLLENLKNLTEDKFLKTSRVVPWPSTAGWQRSPLGWACRTSWLHIAQVSHYGHGQQQSTGQVHWQNCGCKRTFCLCSSKAAAPDGSTSVLWWIWQHALGSAVHQSRAVLQELEHHREAGVGGTQEYFYLSCGRILCWWPVKFEEPDLEPVVRFL